MYFLLNLWRKLVNLGVVETLPLNEQRNVRLLNQITMGTLIGVSLLVLENILLASPFLSPLFTAIYLASILYVNYLRKYLLAQRLYVLFFPLIVTAVIIIYGDDIRLEYSYLVFVLTTIIFFNSGITKWLLFIYYGILYGASQYYVSYYKSPLEADIEDVEKYVIFVLVSLVVGLIINAYIKSNLEFERKNVMLVDKLKKQNLELNVAYDELEKFSYIASHDLKSPLRNIVSFSGLLKRRIKDDDESSKEYLDFIINATTQMNYLITDVLEYSKFNNLKNINLQSIDLNLIVEEAVNQVKASEQYRDFEVQYESLSTIVTNEFILVTVFQNLIKNGIKYNDSAIPVIGISSEVNQKSKQITIAVKDNGIGIASAFQEQIFEMFKRLHKYDEYPGSGLGLAQCKKMIEKLGGSIWVESGEQKGATFYIQLPYTS